ncbi:hypothetical protein B0J13DRAFT_625367 [Dactylonectria estremocensis]|uniref:Rhodopsin domain-containing protein n=1 Tax=Dactylonectria estremocensis TaxID=1079267 RepID=A0A9P9EEA0_9HYPO|nr:hypothetical protein B0J13DRAFT_625367 [Dactylonectria estremocensis]
MGSNTEKLTTTTVPLNSRPEVRQALLTVIVFCVLIAVWSALRLYARRVRHTPLNVEDTLFYVSVAAYYGMAVAFFLLLYFGGVGYHMDQLGKGHVARLTQSMLAVQGLYGLSMCTSKWSILWMLKRVFAVRMFWICTWIIIVVQAAWMIMTLLIGLLICRPIQKNWDPTADGTCGDQIAGYTAVSIINVIVDVAMCLLPIPVIWGLQVKKPYKMALFGIFGIGVVSVIFAIIRLISLRKIDFDDFSYSVPEVITWTYAECGVVILVACSPLLRPIFDKLFRRFLSSAKRTDQYGPSYESRNFQNSANTVPKMGSKMRSGFMTVGESEESLELGDIRSEGRIQSKATASRETRPTNEEAGIWSPDKDLKMGIMVEKEVSQTVKLVK